MWKWLAKMRNPPHESAWQLGGRYEKNQFFDHETMIGTLSTAGQFVSDEDPTKALFVYRFRRPAIGTIAIEMSDSVPHGEIHVVNRDGNLICRYVNVGVPAHGGI